MCTPSTAVTHASMTTSVTYESITCVTSEEQGHPGMKQTYTIIQKQASFGYFTSKCRYPC